MRLSQAIQGYQLAALSSDYSPLTISTYVSAMKILCDFLGDPDLASITDADLQRFVAHLRTHPKSSGDEISTASLHRYWKAMRSFWKWAEQNLKTTRPDASLPMPRHQNREIIPYSEDEVKRLLKACEFSAIVNKSDKKPYRFPIHTARRNRAITLTLLDTGLRASELCRIKLQEINLESGEIQIRPHRVGKTRARVVVIGKQTRRALWQYLAEREELRPSDPLFLTEDGRPMTRYTLCSMYARLGKRAQVPGAHPHRFRHTFAIQYLRNGGDIFTLQRLLGHATLEMVRRYLMLAQTDAAEAHRRASPVDNWKL